jgi:hypothetical protein
VGTVRPSSPPKGVYTPKGVLPHAASLRQACAHCGKSLAAASRRSGGRVSVPLWLAVLSDQLPIIALVGRDPTNQLIGRRTLLRRLPAFLIQPTARPAYAVLPRVSAGYPPPQGRFPTCYAPVRHGTRVSPGPSDLHALGTPPALILSQDQTRHQTSTLPRGSAGSPPLTPRRSSSSSIPQHVLGSPLLRLRRTTP